MDGPLRLILWAGDCIHNGVTDIERLPQFDVYLCYGYKDGLEANKDFLSKRAEPGIIYTMDIFNTEEMTKFVELFRGRFYTIESDYHGNTPTLPLEIYQELLNNNGKAFNIKGINSCVLPVEDFQNMLELFAPILSEDDNYRRTWTAEIMKLAKMDKIPPSAVWTSPDFQHPFYNRIREDQDRLFKWNENRNPYSPYTYLYSSENIEEYWSNLPMKILITNIDRVPLKKYSMFYERFKKFLIQKTGHNIEELSVLQKIYELSFVEGIEFGDYLDTRKNIVVFGHWISKARKNSAVE